jgi:molecular chaperone GrpE
MTDHDAAAGAQAGGSSSEETAARDALAQAEATAQENWNRYLRAAAELDNARKRAARDVEQARKFGVERLAGDMLAVLDSLERGVEAGPTASVDALLEGKKATLRLLKAALERAGVTELAPSGQLFDPQLHEALSIRPTRAAEPGAVLELIQKGYQLNGRLLRPARVVVAGPEPDAQQAGSDAPPDGTA